MLDDNDEIDEEDVEGEEGKKKGFFKIVFIGGLGVVIFLLGVVVVFFLLLGGEDEYVVVEGEYGEEGGYYESVEVSYFDVVYYYDLCDGDGIEEIIIINIWLVDGCLVIVQFKLIFELLCDDLGFVLEEYVDLIMDQFIVFLCELCEDDFYGFIGMQCVCLELFCRVNFVIEFVQVDVVWI